jgi:hypothetical protein
VSRIAVLGYHKIGTRPDGRDSWFYIPHGALNGICE